MELHGTVHTRHDFRFVKKRHTFNWQQGRFSMALVANIVPNDDQVSLLSSPWSLVEGHVGGVGIFKSLFTFLNARYAY